MSDLIGVEQMGFEVRLQGFVRDVVALAEQGIDGDDVRGLAERWGVLGDGPNYAEVLAQDVVGAAVEARGYRVGWNEWQFVARQVAKLGEELGELAACMALPIAVDDVMWQMGATCKAAFDDKRVWDGVGVADVGQAKRELADVVVVALALADSLQRLYAPYDVVAEAVAKAGADVSRGVRADNDKANQ
jgi:hypothetical protein